MKNILLISSDPIMHIGLESCIKDFLPAEIIHGKDSSLIQRLKERKYDLLIFDVDGSIEAGFGIYQLNHILEVDPALKILILSEGSEISSAQAYLKAGAKSYIRKRNLADNISPALDAIFRDKLYLSPELLTLLTKKFFGQKSDNPFESLTVREMEICMLLLKGLGIGVIAKRLNVHTSTASTFKIKIYKKLRIKTVIELMELAQFHDVAEAG